MKVFIDEAKIIVRAGSGGSGCNSLYKDKIERRGRADGGPGGKGGDVIMCADENVQTLLDFYYNKHFFAENGKNGGSNHKKGKNGEDLIIRVPAGTTIHESQTELELRDIAGPGESVVIAKGGRGGSGNTRWRPAIRGEPGVSREIILRLRLIADVGIIGYPNAGKSMLLSRISNARPKIADYPFTTKNPVLGVVKRGDEAQCIIADIPGLIEGAHLGKGLGDRFLRHIERTRLLIHLIDIAAVDGRDPYHDFTSLNKELKSYSDALGRKKQVVALNKIDLESAGEHLGSFKRRCRRKVYQISALTGEGIDGLLKTVFSELKKIRDTL